MSQKAIGAKIRELRSKMGLTTVTLARKVKLSEAQIGRLEKGLQGFRQATLLKFAKALNVPPNYFYVEGKETSASKVAEELEGYGVTPSRGLRKALANPAFLKFTEKCAKAFKTHRKNLERLTKVLAQDKIHLLDVVALNADLPEQGLLRGQVGTVVEELAPGVFEVEFSDDEGRTYATAALRAEQLIILHYHPAKAS
jgi:transcriptional regulator with XRE-family HTH domain